MKAMVNKTTLQKTTGEQVRALRESRGLTQTALAKVAGIHPVTMNRIEQGVQLPDWPTVCNLADALGVTSDKLRKS